MYFIRGFAGSRTKLLPYILIATFLCNEHSIKFRQYWQDEFDRKLADFLQGKYVVLCYQARMTIFVNYFATCAHNPFLLLYMAECCI